MYHQDYEHLSVEVDAGVATVTFQRADDLNAFNRGLHGECEELWPRLARDSSVLAIVLTGAGQAFSAGGDLKGMSARVRDPAANFRNASNTTTTAFHLLRGLLDIPQPVVAAVNGDAIGLGATVALACDIVVMSEDARIGDTHVKVGLVAGDGGAVLWPLLVGPARAKDFLMRGRVVKGAEAERMGLVGHSVPKDEVFAHAREIARELASLPPLAVQWTKRSVAKQIRQQFELAFDASIAFEAVSMLSADHSEAVHAFLEKRPARFGGQ